MLYNWVVTVSQENLLISLQFKNTTVYGSHSHNFVKKINTLFILFMEIKQGTVNHQTKCQLKIHDYLINIFIL